MKFYLVKSIFGETIGCFTCKAKAMSRADQEAMAQFGSGCEVQRLICKPNAETVRRLLSGEGGYAEDIITVYVAKRPEEVQS